MVPKPHSTIENATKPWPRRQSLHRVGSRRHPLKTIPRVGYLMQWRRLGAESCVGYMLLVIERPGYKTQLICPICPLGVPNNIGPHQALIFEVKMRSTWRRSSRDGWERIFYRRGGCVSENEGFTSKKVCLMVKVLINLRCQMTYSRGLSRLGVYG